MLLYFICHSLLFRAFAHMFSLPVTSLSRSLSSPERSWGPSSLTARRRENLFDPMSGLQGLMRRGSPDTSFYQNFSEFCLCRPQKASAGPPAGTAPVPSDSLLAAATGLTCCCLRQVLRRVEAGVPS